MRRRSATAASSPWRRLGEQARIDGRGRDRRFRVDAVTHGISFRIGSGQAEPTRTGMVRGPRTWPADQVTAVGSARSNSG